MEDVLQQMRSLQFRDHQAGTAQAAYGQHHHQPRPVPPPPTYQQQQLRSQMLAQDLVQVQLQQSNRQLGEQSSMLAARQQMPGGPGNSNFTMLQMSAAHQPQAPPRRPSLSGYQSVAQNVPGVLLSHCSSLARICCFGGGHANKRL